MSGPREPDGVRPADDEAGRILQEYQRREREIPRGYYSVFRPGILLAYQQRVRGVLRALARGGFAPLDGRRVLDVGCGEGGWLLDFETWGARRNDLAGIELDPGRGAVAQARLCGYRSEGGRLLSPGADIRIGDASQLPWEGGTFDLVLLSTVFSSILDGAMRVAVASEAARVLKGRGAVLWYDFFVDNPSNPNVRGVGAREIRRLFPEFSIVLRRVTLAPPLARRLAPITWTGAQIVEDMRLLNTHYLGLLRKEEDC